MKLQTFIRRILLGMRVKRMNVYSSYDHALADSHTYEDPDLIQVVSSKTEVYRKALLAGENNMVTNRQLVQNMFVLSYVCYDRPLTVVEIGGACGASYFELSHLLPGRIKRWYVVETPAMAAAGRRLFQDDKLIFYDDLDVVVSQLEKPDLFVAQGVLQYVKDPLKILEAWLKSGFAYVYITRTLVGDGIVNPIITKQVANLSVHGPGDVPKGFKDRKSSQPMTIVPFETISSHISGEYTVLYSFMEGKNSIRFGSRTVTTRLVGFLLTKDK